MRTFRDRLRHTVLFEIIAIAIATVGGSWIVGKPIEIMGTLSLMFSALAMSWNFLFNWMFDHWDRMYRNSARRGFLVRAIHAILFEAGILIAGVFLVAWWLNITYWHAFVIDIGFSAFFLFYAYAFNWAYDHVFPVTKRETIHHH